MKIKTILIITILFSVAVPLSLGLFFLIQWKMQKDRESFEIRENLRNQIEKSINHKVDRTKDRISNISQSTEMINYILSPKPLRTHIKTLLFSKIYSDLNEFNFITNWKFFIKNEENKAIATKKKWIKNNLYITKKISFDDNHHLIANGPPVAYIKISIDEDKLIGLHRDRVQILTKNKSRELFSNERIKINYKDNQKENSYVFLISFIIFLILGVTLSLLFFKIKIIDPIQHLTSKISLKLNENEKPTLENNEIKRLEHAVEKYTEYLNVKNKQEILEKESKAKAEIARQVIHDIKSPLSALKVGISGIDEFKTEKKLIRMASHRIETIINDLSQSHYFNGSMKKKIFIIETIEDLIFEKKHELYLNKNIQIKHLFSKELKSRFFYGNSNKFIRICSNIINNSIEAIENNGEILIFYELKNEKIKINIQDNGKGILKENIEKIFFPGFSTKNKKKELKGLGLWDAKKTILSWGGEINLESEKNKFTRVTIELQTEREKLQKNEISLSSSLE
ncbi:MAG: hypothetical protein CL678_03790 [Bdellovibrionaceae bacterium]|nr:hypothetical protein [Pseudobdellovibrionaceae bacterium]